MKDYDIIMCLNWILKTQILKYLGMLRSELNTWSIDRIKRENFHGIEFLNSEPTLSHCTDRESAFLT